MDKKFTNIISERFNNINSFLKAIESREENEIFYGKTLLSYNKDRTSTVTNSYEEAISLLRNGWKAKSKEILGKIQKDIGENRTIYRQKYDIQGFQASVPRYLQGIPHSMISHKKEVKKSKIINIYRNSTYNAITSTNKIEEESIKVMNIIRILESKGYKCNLFLVFCTCSRNEVIKCKIKIKSSNERLNISKLSFSLIHPCMLRRIFFRYIETVPNLSSNGFYMVYGCGLDFNQMKKYNLINFEENDIVLDNFIDMKKTLNKYGISYVQNK